MENGKKVFLFQGVGSDLDKSLSAFSDEEKEVLYGLCEEVSEYTGIDLKGYIEDRTSLKDTDACFAEWLITGLCDCTVFELFRRAGIEPDYIVGYSLGLNNAMCCSGAITLKDSAEILRGVISSMKKSLDKGTNLYDMGMIIGLERSTVSDIIQKVSSPDRIKIASENSEYMIVVSGITDDVNAVLAEAHEEGALKSFPLCVPSPFHTSLMEEYASPYFENLKKLEFADSSIPMISIYSQKEFSTAEESYNEQCRNFLEQMKWKDTIDYLEEIGVREFYDMSVTAANKKASVLNNPESGFKTIKSLRKSAVK